MNLKFKSSEPDLKFNLQSQIRIINSNLLYITHAVDAINRDIHNMKVSLALEKQASEYLERDYQKDTEHIPEEE